jgi:hypothetical protein
VSQVIEENVYLRNINEKVILHMGGSNYDPIDSNDAELINQKELKKKVKAFHKRQKTHVNFHHISNVNKDTIITSQEPDLFDLTITELNSSRTMRKVSDIDTRETAESGSSIPVNTSSSLNKPLGKQQYLFYRTPNNKDTKKIDFTEPNINNQGE